MKAWTYTEENCFLLVCYIVPSGLTAKTEWAFLRFATGVAFSGLSYSYAGKARRALLHRGD